MFPIAITSIQAINSRRIAAMFQYPSQNQNFETDKKILIRIVSYFLEFLPIKGEIENRYINDCVYILLLIF